MRENGRFPNVNGLGAGRDVHRIWGWGCTLFCHTVMIQFNLGVPGQGFKVLGGTPERVERDGDSKRNPEGNQASFAQFRGGKSGVGNCQTCIIRGNTRLCVQIACKDIRISEVSKHSLISTSDERKCYRTTLRLGYRVGDREVGQTHQHDRKSNEHKK